MATKLIVDPKNPREIKLALDLIRALPEKKHQRPHKIEITELRDSRSNRQNALYWVAIIEPFADYLFEHGYGAEFGDLKEHAHQTLKDELLRVPFAHPETGEVLGHRTRSTTELDTKEFSHYVEEAARWIAEHCGFGVHLPSDNQQPARAKG